MQKKNLVIYDHRRLKRSILVAALDVLWIAASFFLALWIRFEFRASSIPARFFDGEKAALAQK